MEEFLLYTGESVVETSDGQRITAEVQVVSQLQPAPRLTLRTEIHDPTFFSISAEDIRVSIPVLNEPIACFVRNWTCHAHKISAELGPTRSAVELQILVPLFSVRLHILNFFQLFPSVINLKTEDGWVLHISNASDREEDGNTGFRHIVTNFATIKRSNGESFSVEQVRRVIKDLLDFLSFAKGAWIAASIVTGLAANGSELIIEWGIRRFHKTQISASWFDGMHSTELLPLFAHFRRIRNSEWVKKEFDFYLYMFARAETNSAGPDVSLLALQALLESLAAMAVRLRRRGILGRDPDGQTNITGNRGAAGKIEDLLSSMKIPMEIPKGEIMKSLRLYCAQNEIDSGPAAIVNLRKVLAHAECSESRSAKRPFYPAYLLAKWYCELVMLNLCNYQGMYFNRTIHSWLGEREFVPWSHMFKR
ncbi:MAG: hypothetical protein JSS87_04525 [Acidobacteria bacterium]|nr:hypothetical protein [Acidobacteriota bacterium]